MSADLSQLDARPVAPEGPFEGETPFAVLTLMTDASAYAEMVESFRSRGFDAARCAFLYGDNRAGNAFDGYSGLTRMIAAARARYVILAHQDVRAEFDDADTLLTRLEALEAAHPDWAVAGNAGRQGEDYHLHISDPVGEDRRMGRLPHAVEALDENFLVLKRESLVAPSVDLQGFHLYGLDLVQNARARGFGAYAIDFHLRHLSRGTIDRSYLAAVDAYERKHARLMRPRMLRSLNSPVYLTPNRVGRLRWLRTMLGHRKHLRWQLEQSSAQTTLEATHPE